MIEINKNPGKTELRWFGLALLAFFSILGGMVFWRTGSLAVPRVLWTIGVSITALYYLAPPLRRPLFIGWSYLTFPLGWLLTHAILAIVYFVLLTPVGLVMKILGRDPLTRSFDPEKDSYWVRRPPTSEPSRYFRQY